MGRTAEQFAESDIPNGIQRENLGYEMIQRSEYTDSCTDVADKGIAGRAILVDWYRWAKQNKKTIEVTSSYGVPFEEIVQVLEYQGIDQKSIRAGDIVLIRFGYIEQYTSMDPDKRAQLHNHYKSNKPDNIGIKPSQNLLKFLWEHKIAAVGGDGRSFEVWPCTELKWHLHEWLLAGWGMPIGELFDLEALSEHCHEKKRYTFFISSAPMNVSQRPCAMLTMPGSNNI